MFRRYLSLALVGFLLNLTFYSTAMANTQNEAEFAEKVKANIAKLGTGRDAKVEIKLKDGTILKGYVSQTKDSGFFVLNEKTLTNTEIQYLQVKQVKGQNLSSGKGTLLRTSLIVGAIFLYGYYLSRSSDY